MDLGLEALSRASATGRMTHRPEFFRLNDPSDRQRLGTLLKQHPDIQVHDHLHGQLEELVKTSHPSIAYTAEALREAALAHLGNTPSEEYGVWVHYPWSKRLVHLLDRDEFIRVRTDRNRNKITSEEQALLGTKRVGIIGLSVGQSVALALAMERGFGELRIADHDTLELSNLNRIRSSVHELGIPKVINVAREIAEIDPFLEVKCLPEGITHDNLEHFLTEGGQLDILIDECDSTAVKIRCRQRAQELGIAVVMDTSDRGLVDVERYDREPTRPIMHGLLEHADLSDLNEGLSPARAYELIMTMVNADGLSARMKASLPEIGRSLRTWPQLGSHVALGGSVVADVCRRMNLGQMDWSGRWYIDLDELLLPERSNL